MKRITCKNALHMLLDFLAHQACLFRQDCNSTCYRVDGLILLLHYHLYERTQTISIFIYRVTYSSNNSLAVPSDSKQPGRLHVDHRPQVVDFERQQPVSIHTTLTHSTLIMNPCSIALSRGKGAYLRRCYLRAHVLVLDECTSRTHEFSTFRQTKADG